MNGYTVMRLVLGSRGVSFDWQEPGIILADTSLAEKIEPILYRLDDWIPLNYPEKICVLFPLYRYNRYKIDMLVYDDHWHVDEIIIRGDLFYKMHILDLREVNDWVVDEIRQTKQLIKYFTDGVMIKGITSTVLNGRGSVYTDRNFILILR